MAVVTAVDDSYAQLVGEALEVLDRYRAPMLRRDPVRSLNEDREELLGRIQAALERLISDGGPQDVPGILRRIELSRLRAHPGQ